MNNNDNINNKDRMVDAQGRVVDANGRVIDDSAVSYTHLTLPTTPYV